ncbi:MAG: hypothetical protein P4L91_14780 [Burkholderiaceae bacterium]|nr:hypothetical protein [Burkholderiaceae bacterium]
MQRVLSFERSPSFSVPLRFFLTAPAFAIAAGIVVAWHGPQAFESRWSPVTLALTHMLTLGVLTMSMIGALFQILHVVAGVEIPRVRLTASVVHALLALGVCTFVAAFLTSEKPLFQIALFLLLAAFVCLLGACTVGLLRTESSSATLTAIHLSLLALTFAVMFGGTLAGVFGWGIAVPFMLLGDLHVGFGLLGWVGLLVVGVAYQVVPMFQMTPIYPSLLTKGLAPILFLLLCLWGVATAIVPPALGWLPIALAILIATGYAIFSATTIYLLWRRKRKTREATSLFWLTGLTSLLLCVGLWAVGESIPGVKAAPAYPIALGILFVVGFAYTTINGMLYKIVPFLVWYHLQNRTAQTYGKAPNVKQIVPDRSAFRQFVAHVGALLLLLGASMFSAQLARLAGVAFAVSSALLWVNLLNATRIYWNQSTQSGAQ